MATDSNTLLDEAKCLGCASNSSTSDLLKLGILGRIASAYSAVQSFISRAGITDPIQIAAVLALAESAVANGWWGKCDLIYPFVGGTALAHSQNLKSSNFTITWNGVVTHNANGITGDAATGYGNTAYIPNSSGQISVNSVHASIYRRTTGTLPGRAYFGSFTGGVTLLHIVKSGAGNGLGAGLNDTSGTAFSLASIGFSVGSRTESTRKFLFSGGSSFEASLASTSIINRNTFVLGSNNGAPVLLTDANLAGLTLGSGMTFSEYQLMAADWQTFQTALGRQV